LQSGWFRAFCHAIVRAPALNLREKMDALASSATGADDEPRASQAAIAVEGLVKRYRDVLAVDNISFTAPHGSFTALLGGN
jgi:ABC-type transport system involved in cytochrome bd biosynthesis fused ATPase/permease subunit